MLNYLEDSEIMIKLDKLYIICTLPHVYVSDGRQQKI